MNITVTAKSLKGSVDVCASKSEAHRLLICAFLAFAKTEIICNTVSEDIEATVNCIRAMGAEAEIDMEQGKIFVDSSMVREKIGTGGAGRNVTLDCGESGSTLRFIIPVVCALGLDATLTGRGRLPQRPNKPLIETLSQKGCRFDREDGLPLVTKGRLESGEFVIQGNISSQYISGLLFALPLLHGDSVIKMTGGVESKPYIMITLEALEKFGVTAEFCEDKDEIRVKGGQKYVNPHRVKVNGDWSNGAFWLVAEEISAETLRCEGLVLPTKQGDSAILGIISRLREEKGRVIIDASQFPDLVPIISVLAAARPLGDTVICGAARLKIKESNRIESVASMIKLLGGSATETEDGLIIKSVNGGRLRGGEIDSALDHRIVMSAAVASIICDGKVTIKRAEAVAKSYPAFFDEFERLGGQVERSDG